MKATNNRLGNITFAILILLISISSVFAYPPDNAAILYSRACLLHQDEDYEHLRELAVRSRKEGWNAAIDKVIEICISIPGFPGGERFEKIDSLKEP